MSSSALQQEFGIPRFRALIIGRPNAGKTTILRCIAQAADGRVDPSSGRGEHDIKDELVFDSNKGFVFHDSRGIESGTTHEMDIIQDFISERAKATSLKEKLHAIWYCIPTDNSRLLTAAEEKFFDRIDPNGVPVLLIFTKFESQESVAFQKLLESYPYDEALRRTPEEARNTFEQEHLTRFRERKYPPKEIVFLKDMDKKNPQHSQVIELTTRALTSDTLKWLLVTVQETNIKIRVENMLMSKEIREALNAYQIKKPDDDVELAKNVLGWFLHKV